MQKLLGSCTKKLLDNHYVETIPMTFNICDEMSQTSQDTSWNTTMHH